MCGASSAAVELLPTKTNQTPWLEDLKVIIEPQGVPDHHFPYTDDPAHAGGRGQGGWPRVRV